MRSNSRPGRHGDVLLFLLLSHRLISPVLSPNPFPRVGVGLGFPSVQKSVLLDVIIHPMFSFHDRNKRKLN